MKLGILALALTGLSLSTVATAQASGALVQVPGDDLFIPVGFDDNDETVFVVDGYLPSGCYRLTRPEIDFDQDTGVVSVKPMARYFDMPCIAALIPYHFEVRLGVMPMGEFTVEIAGTDVKETLRIREATSAGPDDHLYAPVDDVSINRAQDGTLKATLTGRLTNSCMTFTEIQISHTGKTVQLLPIMGYEQSDTCEAGEFPYKNKITLPAGLDRGRHLLHVRSLNGRDANQLFTVE